MFSVAVADRGPTDPNVVIVHPNRDKPVVKATKATVILLLLASAGLMTIVMIGGWKVLAGQKPTLIGYILVYLILAFYAGRWNRGVLPVAAALAIILGIFALVAGPQWFARDKTGFQTPALSADLLGLLTFLVVPVQVLLIAFAMRGFQQDWHVEAELRSDGSTVDRGGDITPRPRTA
jgi:hypothetical protein